ncbi:MAG TPA: hypothetical protein VFD92_13540 [Candidatus Binatia bacterium]|nr:hypothetical protein [Candidatus Binatia bacterium]
MADNGSPDHGSRLSGGISVGKDLLSLLRDASLFILAVLLVVFPSAFNAILVNAGFEEGSIVGFKWKSKLFESDAALQQAQTTITDLQTKNDQLAKVLSEVTHRLSDPSLTDRTARLEQENEQLKTTTRQVAANVAQTIAGNAPLVSKATPSTNNPTRRSDYLVGVQTLGMPEDVRQNLNETLSNAGYGLNDISASYQLNDVPPWFAQRSTVLYYAASALPAAKELASVLKQATGVDFSVQRGSGLGVDPSQRDITFFVHYRKS